MQNPSFLNVVSTEVRTDKNKRNYNYITVKGDDIETFVVGNRTINAVKPSKQSATTAYEENYLGQQDFGWNLKKGDAVLGAIVTRSVSPYDITGQDGTTRSVNTYSSVVFGDTRDTVAFEVEVQRVFKSAGHPLNEVATPVVVSEDVMKG